MLVWHFCCQKTLLDRAVNVDNMKKFWLLLYIIGSGFCLLTGCGFSPAMAQDSVVCVTPELIPTDATPWYYGTVVSLAIIGTIYKLTRWLKKSERSVTEVQH